jgi:hypothetical protein
MTILMEPTTLRGSVTPRVFTPPLRELTPDTSYGFEVIDFAEEIGHPLLPWQEFAVIHGGELLPDGRPRFRILILLVSRQNGKTELPVVLSVYWQFRKKLPLILGTSTKLAYAKESWQKAIKLVQRTRSLDDLHEPGRKWYRRTNGETESWTNNEESRYLIAASNEEGGRSLTIDRGICDELRQHDSYAAWGALEPACSPVDAQIWAMSNAGSAKSVVLNDFQDAATEYIRTGVGDRRLGLMEWSAPEDADPEDVGALLAANPRVGYGLDLEVLLSGAARAKRLGGEALTSFKTESMCIRVKVMNPALEPAKWRACAGAPETFEDLRGKVALVAEVSPSMQSASVYAAAVQPDGRVRVGPVDAWDGPQAMAQLRAALPGLIATIKPRAFGWLPGGPAAALDVDLKDRNTAGRRAAWPPAGVAVEEIRGEKAAVCMGLAEQVVSGRVWHTDDPRLNDQAGMAEKRNLPSGTWEFSRNGEGECDAVYAAAGAVHLARTLPPPIGVPRLIVASA